MKFGSMGGRGALWLAAVLAVGCGEQPAEKGTSSTTNTPAGTSGSGPVKRLVILTNGNSPFWDACRAGMQEAEKDLNLAKDNLQAVFEVNDGTPNGQLAKLRDFASQTDVAGVGVSAIDASNAAIADQLRTMQKNGIAIITIDSDVDREKFADARFAFVGTDNFEGGRQLGICARELRPQGGTYVTFVGRTGAQNAIERVNGFAAGAGEKFKALDNMGDDLDRTRARDNVRNALANHPSLTTLVGIWSYNAPAIVDVVKELNKGDAVDVVTFDAEPLAISQMGQGLIDAMVVQNPYAMGYQGLRLLRALHLNDEKTIKEMLPNKGQKGGDLYDTGLKVVVPEKQDKLKKEQFAEKVEFLRLNEFNEWLKKYNLTGS